MEDGQYNVSRYLYRDRDAITTCPTLATVSQASHTTAALGIIPVKCVHQEKSYQYPHQHSCCPDTGGAVQPVSPGCGTRHCFPVKLNGKISPWVRTMSGLGYTLYPGPTIPPTRPLLGGGGGRGGFLWGAQGECWSCQ